MNKPVSSNDMNALIMGCGDVGRRLASRLSKAGQPVSCQVRSEQSLQALSAAGFNTLRLDLAEGINNLPDVTGKQVYYFIPPPSSGRRDPLMTNFIRTIEQSGQIPASLLYISTTGVYGDCKGRRVNEQEPVKPAVDRAYRRLDAEQQLQEYASRSGCRLVILRVAGIYGPGKLPLARLQKQLPVIRPEESPFTNRIHIDDLVSVCINAMQKAPDGAIYNVSDGNPGTMADYFSRVAERAGLPAPPQISLEEGFSQLSEGMMSYMQESRRLDNRLMLDELGLSLDYPDLEAGLDQCFSPSSAE
jgi:nucleoside-diphosphate-sugar epimerase